MARRSKKIEEVAKKAVEMVARKIPVTGAYLFGSQISGKAGPSSDIDLAIFSPAVKKMDLLDRVKFMVDIEKNFKEPLELHLYSSDKLREARPTNFYGEIIRTGEKIK